MNLYWSFIRKDLCEGRPKTQSVFKFSDVLFALSQMTLHSWCFRSGWHFWQIFESGWPFGQMYPNRWGFRSGWHLVRFQVRMTFGQTYPQQWHLVAKCVSTSVRLTSDQMYPLAETSCAQVCYYFGQADLWSDVPPGRDILWPHVILFQSGWPPVRCTPTND